MADAPYAERSARASGWAAVLLPVLVAALGVAAIWGAFQQRLSAVEDSQKELRASVSDLARSVIDLRITVATTNTQLSILNDRLHDRDAAARMGK